MRWSAFVIGIVCILIGIAWLSWTFIIHTPPRGYEGAGKAISAVIIGGGLVFVGLIAWLCWYVGNLFYWDPQSMASYAARANIVTIYGAAIIAGIVIICILLVKLGIGSAGPIGYLSLLLALPCLFLHGIARLTTHIARKRT